MYIEPTLHIHTTLAAAKEFYDTFGPHYFWSEKPRVGVPEVVQGKRNLIIGEPGIGKTLLLEKIQEYLNDNGTQSKLIYLKEENPIALIDEFLRNNSPKEAALLLDGLDEVRGSLFPAVLEKIEEASNPASRIAIYISSRSVFANRHAASFSEYRIITISPFTNEEVKKYLVAAGQNAPEIDTFLAQLTSLGQNMLVIQIPRYLYLLSKYLAKNQIASVGRVSRNQLFEYFIYAKLKLEENRLNTHDGAITKRLLEKLALTMEVYQSTTISKDEFMTFLDELQSDLKLGALAQLSLQKFFDKSLLKDNHESIEFENTEFQEYLAAKEITRFSDPRVTAFTFAVESKVNDIHPAWFNTLTFLVDMRPDLIEQLIEFSGIRGTKIVDEGFLTLLSGINPNNVALALKSRLFNDLLAYHQRHLQWMSARLASRLPALFNASDEIPLKSGVSEAIEEVGPKRFVPLGNIALIVGYLFEAGTSLDQAYWRKRLIEFASDDNDNGVLQRHALFGMEKLKDPSVLDDLPSTLMDKDELVARAFLKLCVAIAPESQKSISYFLEATRRGEIHGRYGLYELRGREALKIFLTTFKEDVVFRQAFLDKCSIFREQDHVILEHIRAVCDRDILELCEEAILRAFQPSEAHQAERSAFVLGLGKILMEKVTNFLPVIIERIRSSQGPSGFYFTKQFFAGILERQDVPLYLAVMIAAGEQMAAFSVLLTAKYSNRKESEEIFEAGRPFLVQQYVDWDKQQLLTTTSPAIAHESQLYGEFKKLLDPGGQQYSTGVFAFYLKYSKDLDPLLSSENRMRLAYLIKGSVFKSIDPKDYDLTVTKEDQGHTTTFSVSSNISLFSDALRVADHLSIDLTEYRQRIINFIPFAYGSDLRAIFRLATNITATELTPVIEIYRDHRSDLWRHMPRNLVEAVEQNHIIDAASVLQAFVKESIFPSDIRRRALEVADSLVSDMDFLNQITSAYQDSTDPNEATVAEAAINLLITRYSDPNAIRQKLRAVVERAAPFNQPTHAHIVSSLEEEIFGGKGFAAPLMQLKARGYEQDYLLLLDCATSLWARGKDFYAYSNYLWDIVFAYFDNLKEFRSYEPLQTLETKLAAIRNDSGANWFAARMLQLRRAYLAFLGKPQNITEAIQQYNYARLRDNKKIINSQDLMLQLKAAIETDLTRWIEAEGAYDLLLSGKVYKGKLQQFEKLIQKTLKSQVENIFLKRGFQVEVLREPQLLDEKRTDFLIRYGFAGPVIIELKLASNKDMQASEPEKSSSFISMQQYMKGYGASEGIFLIIDNRGSKSLQRVKAAFEQIPNVWVKVFDYRKESAKVRATRRKTKSRSAGDRKVSS